MKDYTSERFSSVWVQQVIISTQVLRGDGEGDPYRRIQQVFTLDGELIAEYDVIVTESEAGIK